MNLELDRPTSAFQHLALYCKNAALEPRFNDGGNQAKVDEKGWKLTAFVVKQHPIGTLRGIGLEYESITTTTNRNSGTGISIVFRSLDKRRTTSKINILRHQEKERRNRSDSVIDSVDAARGVDFRCTAS